MNTGTGFREQPPLPVDRTFQTPPDGDGYLDKIVEKMERLETELASAKDRLREERFYWIGFSTFLLDLIIARFLDSLPLFLPFLGVEPFVLVGLARHLGVDWAVESIEQARRWISEHVGSGRGGKSGE